MPRTVKLLPKRLPVGSKYVLESCGPFVRRNVELPNGRKVPLPKRRPCPAPMRAPGLVSSTIRDDRGNNLKR
jgi:hypothetical protein